MMKKTKLRCRGNGFRRGPIEIKVAILKATRRHTITSRIYRDANLSYARLIDQLDEFVDKGLVSRETLRTRRLYNSKVRYQLTERGENAIRQYDALIELIT